MMKLFRDLRKDLDRLEGRGKFLNISIWILFNYRLGNYFFYRNNFIIAKCFWLVNRLVFNVDIDPGARLAGGVKLLHPMSIVVGRDVISRGKLTLYQSITLGGSEGKIQKYMGDIIKQPYLENDVIIYTSAILVGPVVVGENSTIAANAVITKNVPRNSIAFNFNSHKQR